MKEDWAECCFEDLLDYEQPTKYIVKSTKYNDKYKTPVLTAGKTFIKGYTNETDGIFDNLPTIIFDDFTTATQYVNFKFKVKSSAMKILVPTSKLVNMPLVYYAMQVNQVRSDTHKRYWISIFSKKEFLLPPLVEQKAIVKKIEELFSSLDSGIADLKKAQDQLVIYRQAVLKKAFEGELTSSKMEPKQLEPFTKLITKGASPKWQGFDYINDKNELLFITSENVREGFVSLEKEKYLPKGFNNVQKRSILKIGDVLLNIVGASIGRAAIFELEKLSNINQAVCLIRLKDEELLKKYLCYYLNSETAKQDYLNKQVDVARANLSLTNVKELEIPFCSPKEQYKIIQEIESRLSVCDAVEENINESLQKAIALRHSILKKAFDGKLLNEEEIAKCKEDKNYEPASVLLEKIKAEKKQK